jgi:hypothetical protein
MEEANVISNTNFSNAYFPTYRFMGQNILLEPTPETTIVGALRLEYLPIPTLMVADGDSPPPGFLEPWQEGIVLRAAISCKQKEEAVVNGGTDVSTLNTLMQNWEQMIKESVEIRSGQRHYSSPFGLDEGSYYYF